jgi:hypothetical protein
MHQRGQPHKRRAFNMCGDVAAPNLYAVAQQNCLQAPDTSMTVMGRRSGSSSSNDDVERAAPKALDFKNFHGRHTVSLCRWPP